MWLLRTKIGRILIGSVIAIVVCALLFFVLAANSKSIIESYNNLGGKPNDSKAQFFAKYAFLTGEGDTKDKSIEFILNAEDENGSIEIGDNGLPVTPGVDDPDLGEYDTGSGEEGGEQPIIGGDYVVPVNESEGDIVIDGWLVLHGKPSPGMYGLDTRHLSVPQFSPNKWSMGEGDTGTNKWMMKMYNDNTWSRPIVQGVEASIGAVNKAGRYWVAIGPSWFNPGLIDGNGWCSFEPGASHWFASGKGEYFDIVVSVNGRQYYIYSCVGDAKAHTFGEGRGFCQSGDNWNASDRHPDTQGWQPIEWPRVPASTGANLDSRMEFVGLIH